MNVEPSTGYLKFLKGIPQLDFDPALVPDYLNAFKSDSAKAEIMDELEYHYDEMDSGKRKERLEMINAINAPGVYFDDPEDETELE